MKQNCTGDKFFLSIEGDGKEVERLKIRVNKGLNDFKDVKDKNIVSTLFKRFLKSFDKPIITPATCEHIRRVESKFQKLSYCYSFFETFVHFFFF